ncbi:hypothetical protein WJX73_009096 [Symbiochloris irregularis]|uniref:Uncharacterized protein n=1 Tax=Symbiochloris irregularis TaxID=706552 RepID=A0AAW1PGA2_9CHLO
MRLFSGARPSLLRPAAGRTALLFSPKVVRRCSLPPSTSPAPAAGAQNTVYKVSYDNVIREVSQAQLEAAPNSLLSKVLLQGDASTDIKEGEVQTRTFTVSFGRETREVTEAELKKAATSLLSGTLLEKAPDSDTLIIPSVEGGDFPAWRGGNEQLFQACMECYTGKLSSRYMPSAEELQSAIVEYFRIPQEMWPLGWRITFKAAETKAALRAKADWLLKQSVQIMEVYMTKLGTDFDALCDVRKHAKMSFFFCNNGHVYADDPQAIGTLKRAFYGVRISPALQETLIEVGRANQLAIIMKLLPKSDAEWHISAPKKDWVHVMRVQCQV